MATEIDHFVHNDLQNNDFLNISVFNHTLTELLPYTNQSRLSPTSISDLNIAHRCGGGTHLWDSICEVVNQRAAFNQEKLRKGKKPKPFIVLVLTDGEDSGSRTSLEATKERLRIPGSPDFHLHLVGIGLTQSAKQSLLGVAEGMNHVEFTALESRDHHVSAIHQGFRHFATTIQVKRRVVIQEYCVAQIGSQAVAKMTERSRVELLDGSSVLSTSGRDHSMPSKPTQRINDRPQILNHVDQYEILSNQSSSISSSNSSVGGKVGGGRKHVVKCKYADKLGGCKNDKCSFSHPTEVCRHFCKPGGCKLGQQCMFLHPSRS